MLKYYTKFLLYGKDKLILAYLFPFFCLSISLFSFQLLQSQEKYNFDYLDLSDGLPAGTGVTSIVQDDQGFLWFTVLGGVAKYDGYNFTFYKNFYTSSDTIYFPEAYMLFLDKDSVLWVGSNNTISYYDKQKDRFNAFYLIDTRKEKANQVIARSIAEDNQGRLWLATFDNGMFSFDKKTNEIKNFLHEKNNPNSLPSDSLSGVAIDKKGMIWISTYYNGLCKFNPNSNSFTMYSEDELGNRLMSTSIPAINKDKFGKIWIAAGMEYLTEIDPENGNISNYPIKGEEINPAFKFCIMTASDSIVWIGCNREGIIKFDNKTKEFTKIIDNNVVNSNQSITNSLSIFQDRSNVIWIGGYEVINKYSNQKQKFYSYKNDPEFNEVVKNAVVHEIKKDKNGNLWLGTTNGIFKQDIETGRFTHFLRDKDPNRDPKSFGENTTWSFCFDKDDIMWVATGGGLYRFDTLESNITYYKNDPYDSNSISGNPGSVFEDSKGFLWIATDQTLEKFDKTSKIFKHYNIPTVRSVYEDNNGIIWAFSGSRGVYRYDPEKDDFVEYYKEDSFIGFSMGTEDKQNRFWISSFFSGINEFFVNTGDFKSYGTSSGLPSDFVNNLIVDNNGMLWVSTRVGLSRFDPDKKIFKNFNEDDGLGFMDFQTTSCYKDTDGKLYFGGRNGLVSFYPAIINKYIPPVAITKFTLLNDTANITLADEVKEAIYSDKEISLEYSNNSFSVGFASLDYNSPKRNQYSYKLVGFDIEWVNSGTTRSATYKNLTPGDYTFIVKGSNDDGVWNDVGSRIKIYISPPWWKTWWFTTIWIILVLGLFGGIVRFISTQSLKRKLRELKYQQELESEKLRISKDMHDEVGSNLTKISLLSEIAKKKLGSIEEIEKITDASKEVVTSMDEIVWAVNPGNDNLENLVAYISKYTEEFLDGININSRFEFPQNIPDIPLQSDVRHNIFLTIKEALNNAVKHSGATTIIVGAGLFKNECVLYVKDDGKGFDINENDRFSNGLSNMEKRINDIGGSFKIISNSGAGTEIKVTVKLDK